MKKRILALFIALCMAWSMVPVTAFAVDAIASGTCGDDLTWVLDQEGTLTISGTGAMGCYGCTVSLWLDQCPRDTLVSMG